MFGDERGLSRQISQHDDGDDRVSAVSWAPKCLVHFPVLCRFMAVYNDLYPIGGDLSELQAKVGDIM